MVYLDYAATNPFVKYSCSERYYNWHFNPNANYAFNEKKLMQECEERVKKAIGAEGGKVVFGGTASQLVENLMNYIDDKVKYYNVVCSAYEHDSTFRFSYSRCIHNVDELKENLIELKKNGDASFLFWQGVNNVVGEVFDIVEIGKLCKKYGVFFLCDVTAFVGHAPIPEDVDNCCSAFWYSGHKIGTEFGIGAMWLSRKLNELLGDFKLHGTPNVAGALAIADATEDAVRNTKTNVKLYDELLNIMKNELSKNNIDYEIVSSSIKTPAINAIRFNGINARALQSYLASKEVYIGLGQSSCTDENDNRILCSGFGLSEKEADEVIRISFGDDSSESDIVKLVEEISNFIKIYT